MNRWRFSDEWMWACEFNFILVFDFDALISTIAPEKQKSFDQVEIQFSICMWGEAHIYFVVTQYTFIPPKGMVYEVGDHHLSLSPSLKEEYGSDISWKKPIGTCSNCNKILIEYRVYFGYTYVKWMLLIICKCSQIQLPFREIILTQKFWLKFWYLKEKRHVSSKGG